MLRSQRTPSARDEDWGRDQDLGSVPISQERIKNVPTAEYNLLTEMMADAQRIAKDNREFKVGRLPPAPSPKGFSASGGRAPKKKEADTVKYRVAQHVLGLQGVFVATQVAKALDEVPSTVAGCLREMYLAGELERGPKTARGYGYKVKS